MNTYFGMAFSGCFFVFGAVTAVRLVYNLSADGWDWNAKSRPAVYDGENPENEDFRLPYWKAFFFPLSFLIVSSATLAFLLRDLGWL